MGLHFYGCHLVYLVGRNRRVFQDELALSVKVAVEAGSSNLGHHLESIYWFLFFSIWAILDQQLTPMGCISSSFLFLIVLM